MCKTKFFASSIFGWPKSKVNKSLGFWCFQHFFESFNLRMTKEWVSEIRTCPRVENLTEFEDRT